MSKGSGTTRGDRRRNARRERLREMLPRDGAVLHNWPDQQAQRIVANIAAAGGSGARLLMIEFVVPPGDTAHLSKMSDLSMLAMLNGKERTETEWRKLLTAADLTGIEIHQTGTPLSVIQATVQ